jgi:beta-lactamase class A
MRYRRKISWLRWVSVLLVLLGVFMTLLQLIRFSRQWVNFPVGMLIADIPVGQLSRQQVADRLLEVYSLPVEIRYNNEIIHLSPNVVGFELDLETMLAAAELERTRQPFWTAFWNHLWGRPSEALDIPLRATYSEERLRNFLNTEIATRYDKQANPATPIVGTVNFQPGVPGTSLDIDRSVLLIDNALKSTSLRSVSLPLISTSPSRPNFQNLEVLIRQTIELANYDGVIGLYLHDLQSGQEINILNNQGSEIPNPPDVAFTGSSTIKIPVMISVYRRLGIDVDADTRDYLQEMIGKSNNASTDWLIENVIDPARGPLMVTDDMQQLGLDNTFLAGYFYFGAPLLANISTPANQRSDINMEPDQYNQTTPSEIGMLLMDIYQCAHTGGGTLIAAFPEEITQSECQEMLDTLALDKTAVLIEAGLPDGTKIAHKHGWVPDIFGIIHDMSDASIVFTPGGNYVLTIYLYHPVQLIFEPSNDLLADISKAIYNYYNIPVQ